MLKRLESTMHPMADGSIHEPADLSPMIIPRNIAAAMSRKAQAMLSRVYMVFFISQVPENFAAAGAEPFKLPCGSSAKQHRCQREIRGCAEL